MRLHHVLSCIGQDMSGLVYSLRSVRVRYAGRDRTYDSLKIGRSRLGPGTGLGHFQL